RRPPTPRSARSPSPARPWTRRAIGSRPARAPGPGWPGPGRERAGGAPPRFLGLLQLWEIAVELELADLDLVVGPFGALVADEPLEDVLAKGLGQQLRALHGGHGVGEARGERTDALGRQLLGRQGVQVGGSLRGQLVALLDALEPGGEDDRERQVRFAR